MNNIAMHILDIVQNSISAKAKLIEISIHENYNSNILTIAIKDNGIGMDEEFVARVIDPYTTTRTTRKVGLGIPLLKDSAQQSNGYIKLNSEKGIGTSIQATFQNDHIDRPPLGDIAGTIVLLSAANPDIDFKYIHQINENKYVFDTREIKNVLDDVRISDPKIRGYLKEMINENVKEIYVI